MFVARRPATSSPVRNLKPRGLWKARARVLHPRSHPRPSPSPSDEDFDSVSSSSSSSKRQRTSLDEFSSSSATSSDAEDKDIYLWDYSSSSPEEFSSSPLHSPVLIPLAGFCQRARRTRRRSNAFRMVTSAVSQKGSLEGVVERSGFDYEDWEDLKELFSRAAEQYENNEPEEALPLIRGVIHECHRCLRFHHDPSVLFSTPCGSSSRPPHPEQEGESSKKCDCIEQPTAFHAVFGTALFLFGNLVAQDSSLTLPGEPDKPAAYWLAALDVFETGENLPSRTHNTSDLASADDWRMAIVWGRTLVCIADEAIKAPPSPSSSGSMYTTAEEPNWAPDSPFSIIAQRRPPVTGRMSLNMSTPHDLMKLAMDQFSRGIFHMPHPTSPSTSTFSRAKELYTLASEVLLVAEKMEKADERQYWAGWADSVFNQMKMEADMDVWRERINRARGQCCLIVGSALAEGFEDALERGDMSVLESEEAEEARESLTDALVFLEKVKGSATKSPKSKKRKRDSDADADDEDDLQMILTEVLLTLANLTVDECQRDELYARAQKESGKDLNLDSNMDVSD